jgi:hypothetical protein
VTESGNQVLDVSYGSNCDIARCLLDFRSAPNCGHFVASH